MKISLYLILAFIFFCHQLAAQPQDYAKTETDRMILAYTYYVKREVSLKVIAEMFPVLKNNVDLINHEWNREFGASVKNIDSILTESLKEEWLQNKAMILNKFSKGNYSHVTENEARQFISSVNAETVGKMQSPILETFLTYDPLYQKFPEQEFINGFVNSFFTNDSHKPGLINIKVLYPKSWRAEPGEKGSDVLQKFTGNFGAGPLTMLITIGKSGKDVSNEAIQKLLSIENFQKGLSADDKVLDYKPKLMIDNRLAAAITFRHEELRSDTKKVEINEVYSTYYKNYHIRLKFTISSILLKEDDINLTYDKYKKLFKKIIDNIVIMDQWGL